MPAAGSTSGSSGGAVTLQRLQVVIEANTSGLAASMASARLATESASGGIVNSVSSIKSAFSGIAKVATAALSFGALASFARQAVALGSDLTEVQNVVDVTFGSMSDDINTFAQNAMKSFGLSETAAKQYASTFGAMLNSTGVASDQAHEMSKNLTKLAADMASFYNLNTDVAFYKIRAGISGENEPLKQLGINMTVANLEAYALSKGIEVSYKKMDQASQAILRYNYLLDSTRDAQGDFARTSETWANQTRILNENFRALQTTIGQGLTQAFLPVVQVLNVVLERLQSVGTAFRNWIYDLTGYQIEESVSGISDAMEGLASPDLSIDISEDGADLEDSLTNSADAAKKVGSNLSDGVARAAQAAKGWLGSLDEINRMTAGGGTLTTPTAYGTSGIEIETPDVSAFDQVALSLADSAAYASDISMTTKETPAWLAWVDEKIRGLISGVGEAWDGVWDGHIGDAVRRFSSFWDSTINPMLGVTKDLFGEMYDKHVAPMVDKIGSFAERILPDVESLVEVISVEAVISLQGVIFSLGIVLDIVGEIFDFFSGIVDFVKLTVDAISGNLTLDTLAENSAGQFLLRSGDWLNTKATDFNAWLYEKTGGEGDPYEAVKDDFSQTMSKFGDILDQYDIDRASTFWQLFRDQGDTRTESPLYYYQQEAAGILLRDIESILEKRSEGNGVSVTESSQTRDMTLNIDGMSYVRGVGLVEDRYNTARDPYSRLGRFGGT